MIEKIECNILIVCILSDNNKVMWISAWFCGLLLPKNITSSNYLNFKVFLVWFFRPFVKFIHIYRWNFEQPSVINVIMKI